MSQTSERLIREVASGQRSLVDSMVFQRLIFDYFFSILILDLLSRSIESTLLPSWNQLFVVCEMQPKVSFQEKDSMKIRNLKGPIFHFLGILLTPRDMNGPRLT